MKEQDIISGCKEKDNRSQKAFVDQYSAYLYGVCRRYINDKELIKDCLQDALVKVLSNMDKYEDQGKFKPWIARIAATECLQTIRRNKRFTFYNVDDLEPVSVQEEVSFKLELADVLAFLDSLSINYRVAINMYIIEGYSHKEIAEHLNITESSSRSLVARGRKMINDLFHKDQMRVVHFSNGKTKTSY